MLVESRGASPVVVASLPHGLNQAHWVWSTSSLGIEIFSCLVPYCRCGGGDPFCFDSVYDFSPPHHFAQQHHLQKPIMILHGFNLRTGVS